MYNELLMAGCSLKDINKCLVVRTFDEFEELLLKEYSGDENKEIANNISKIINSYYNKDF